MNTQDIRPYKWSSWEVETWTRGGNEKAYIFGEQKWADIEIEDEYSLVPIQFHSELSWIDPKDFIMNTEVDTDLIFVIDGISKTLESSDTYNTIEFRGDEKLEKEYEAYKDKSMWEHEILEELGYEQSEAFHIVKFYQRERDK